MFEHLKNLEIRERTSWCHLPEIAPGAALELRPATAENPFYTNASLALAADRPRGKSRTAAGVTTIIDIQEGRADARVLYPKHIVTGWRGIVDSAGAAVAFTVENCVELFRQLPDGLIDDIILHSRNRANFVPDGAIVPNVEALAPNLRSGSSGS